MLSEMSDYDFQVVAVTQEQHAERTRLYKQWKQLDWLILQDSFCEMKIAAVPSLILIDEEGQVAAHRANQKVLESWLKGEKITKPAATKTTIMENQEVKRLTAEADQLIKFPESNSDLDKAIEKYLKAISIDSKIASLQFRLGVAYRMRFDRDRTASDFEKASQAWTTALELNPNQYIFRRRIEQYGPRLIKPYPFYDWVDKAIAEIKERGDDPIELTVALSGAEIALPSRKFTTTDDSEQANPDPDKKINADDSGLIEVNPIIVPSEIRPGKAGRVHLVLAPGKNAKWNNESGTTKVWIDESDGIELTQQLFEVDLPPEATSSESRTFEFEVKLPKNAKPGQKLTGFALFGVCTDDDGVCRYLRSDFAIELNK